MDETKQKLKLLIDFFTNQYLNSLKNIEKASIVSQNSIQEDVSAIEESGNLESSSIESSSGNSSKIEQIISKQDFDLIIKTLESW